MTVLAVSIGNSDDKLSQRQWASFWTDARALIRLHAMHVHGEFASLSTAPYQNACFLVEAQLSEDFFEGLAHLAAEYDQESIAVTRGDTIFVSPSV